MELHAISVLEDVPCLFQLLFQKPPALSRVGQSGIPRMESWVQAGNTGVWTFVRGSVRPGASGLPKEQQPSSRK
jgi:hypothetical protein